MAGGSRNALAASSQKSRSALAREHAGDPVGQWSLARRFDTEVVSADNLASRRCEVQCAIILERVTRNRLVPVYP
jgi:hypothetical protein